MKPYRIQIPVYEGPFELLLALVRKHEISIFDIPVSKITEEYLAYLRVLESFDVEISSEFLVMAATLMHIKSRLLLPQDENAPPGEEGDEGDPRAELIRRLLEYKRYRDAALFLEERERAQRDVYYRSLPPEVTGEGLGLPVEPEGYVEVNLYELVAAFRRSIQTREAAEPMVIAPELVTVGEKVGELRLHFDSHEAFVLSAAHRRRLARAHFIALFLAILELSRLGIIVVHQAEPFTDIRAFRLRDIPEGELALTDYR